jgi:hypothetical protein
MIRACSSTRAKDLVDKDLVDFVDESPKRGREPLTNRFPEIQ